MRVVFFVGNRDQADVIERILSRGGAETGCRLPAAMETANAVGMATIVAYGKLRSPVRHRAKPNPGRFCPKTAPKILRF